MAKKSRSWSRGHFSAYKKAREKLRGKYRRHGWTKSDVTRYKREKRALIHKYDATA